MIREEGAVSDQVETNSPEVINEYNMIPKIICDFHHRRDPLLNIKKITLGPVDVHLRAIADAAKYIMAMKLSSVFSDRMAIRLNSFSF